MYETVADAGLDGGGGAEPEAAAEEAAPEAAPEAAAAAPDYEEMLRSSEGQQALEQAVYEALGAYEQQQPQQQGFDPYADAGQPQDPLGGFDFFDENAPQQLAQILEQRDQALIQQLTQHPAFSYALEQQQSGWADNHFGTIEKQLGGEIPQELREISIAMAAGSRPPETDPSARYFDPGHALGEAATSLHALIQRERQAAVEEYQRGVNPETGTAGAMEPSAGGPAAIRNEELPRDMHETRLRWERNQGLHD
jgi:hypothetical protein